VSDLYPTLSLGEKTPVPNDLDVNFNVAPLQSFSQWSSSSGSNINDPLLSAQGYADYQRGHFFRTGELDDEVESSITQGLVGSLLNNQLVTPEQVESEDFLDTLKPQADAQTQANLIRMAYGERAGSTYLSNIQSESGNQEELDKQLNSAKTLLVDSGVLPFARVKDDKGVDKIIGGAGITDRGKSLDDAVRLGALNYSDAYRVMSGLKKGMSDASVFENIREAQLLTELNAVLGSDEDAEIPQNALDVMRGLIKSKDEDATLDQEQDILAVVGDIRKGLSSAYARKNGFGEGAALERYSDKEIRDAVELLAANEVNEKGEFKFYDEDDSKNIRILGSGHAMAHPNLMQQKERFEKAIKNDDRLSEDQITSLRNQRKLYRQLTYEQYDKFLADTAATSDNWIAAKQAGRASGASDVDILDTFLADKRNYSSIKNRLGDIAATIPDAVVGLFASLGAVVFKSEGATKYLVDNQMDRQRRREVAAIFGDEFGWGMDLSNVVAPMVVDVSATALLSAGTLGAGGVLYAGTKAGTKQTAKALVKNLTKAATGRQFGDTAKDIALKAAARKKGKDSGDKVVSEGVQEAIKAYNKAIANKTFRKAAPYPPLFLTAANRSAGNTYATVYAAQPDSLTHEEKHDAALGYALMAGTTTGLITSAFMGIGFGGFEQAFLRGMTFKGMEAGIKKLTNVSIKGLGAKKAKEDIQKIAAEQLSNGAKKSRFLGQFGIPAASEAAEEGLDEFIQTFIMDAALNENTPMIDRMMVGLHAASLGGVMGAGVVGVQSMFDKGTGARYERFQQQTIDNIIKELGETGSPLTQAYLEENKTELARQFRAAARSRGDLDITPTQPTETINKLLADYAKFKDGSITESQLETEYGATVKEIEQYISLDQITESETRTQATFDFFDSTTGEKVTKEEFESNTNKELDNLDPTKVRDFFLVSPEELEVRETQEGVVDEALERQLEEGRQKAIEQEEQLIRSFDTIWGTKEESEKLGEGLTAEEHYERYQDARANAESIASFYGMDVRVDINENNKFLGAYRAVATEDGMTLIINPWGLARLTMGLNKANAQHVARFEAVHEVIHHAAWRNLAKAEIDVIYSSLSVDQINEIIDTYYKTDTKRANARANLGPDALNVDRINEQHIIVDEFLRMRAQRITKGFTTEQEIEFYKSNPSFVRVFLRYLRSYVNRFNAIRELDADNPVISAALNRLTGEMTRLKGGFALENSVRFDIDDPESSINRIIGLTEEEPFVDRDPNRKIDMGVRQTQEGELDYRGSHRAPDRGYGSPMSAMDEGMYPSDFYSPDGLRLYGTGNAYDTINDQKVYDQIVSVRGKPDAKVTVYRGVPSNVKGGINAGDWVSTDRDYAEMHGARMFGDKGYKVLTKEVKAGELITEGNSIYEFGYSPPTGVRETQAGAFDIDKAVDNLDLDDAAQVESFIKDTLKINDAEFEQLGKPLISNKTGKPTSRVVLPPVQLIRFIRSYFNRRRSIYNKGRKVVEETHDISPPELTFDMFAPTPAMTAALIKNEKVSNWHSDMSNFEIPDGHDTIAFVPCAAAKPWCDIQNPKMGKRLTYKSYNKMRKITDDGGVSKKYGRVYYVTISEPLGVVPQDFWHDFPPYDNTGLFTDPVDQIGRIVKQDAIKLPEEDGGIGQTFALPFDVAAYKESINALGNVIASFVETNKKKNPDLKFVSFVSDLGPDKGSHEIMLDKASEIRGESVVSPNENFKKRRVAREIPAEIMEEKLGPFKYDANLKVDRQKKMEQVSAAAGRIQPVRETQAGSLDAEYMKLAEDPKTGLNDIDLQIMVSEAAKRAGYTYGPVYHGTKSNFTSFKGRESDGLIFFSKSKSFANAYSRLKARPADVEKRIDEAFKKSEELRNKLEYKMMIVDRQPIDEEAIIKQTEDLERSLLDGMTWSEAKRDMGRTVMEGYLKADKVFDPTKNWKEFEPEFRRHFETKGKEFPLPDEAMDLIKQAYWRAWEIPSVIDAVFRKYDAILINEDQTWSPPENIAVRDNTAIKSSKPITRDDNGDIIPLSERFDLSSQDIRYTQAGSLEGAYDNIEDVPQITSQVNERQVASLVKIKTASDLNDPAEQEIFQKAVDNINKDRSGILAVAANRLFEKQITQATYNEIRNKVFPYKNVGQVPKAPNAEDIKNVWRTKESTPTEPVYSSKVKAGGSTKFGAISYNDAFEQLQNQKVSIRLDIPTFNKTIKEKGAPVYAVTIMGPSMEGALAYTGYAKIKLDGIESKVGAATKIATGTNKFLMASTEGELMEFKPKDLNAFRKDWASGKVGPKKTGKDRWVEVAVNPLRSSEFVDVTNPLDPVPVINGSTAIHVGNRVFVQEPVWGSRPDYGREGDVRFTQAGGLESGTFDTTEGGLGYGSYEPVFQLPVFETGEYRKMKEGIFGGVVNKFRGDLDPRVKLIIEQRNQIRLAVKDDVKKFKDQLEKIIQQDFGGKAPVSLIQDIVGSRENISPETDPEYLKKIEGKTDAEITKIRAKHVEDKRKEFTRNKSKAIEKLAELQKVPKKDAYDTELVKHLLSLREKTNELSRAIRNIVGADSEIGVAITDNLDIYIHRKYRLFSDKDYKDKIKTDPQYHAARENAGNYLFNHYKLINKNWRDDMRDAGFDPSKEVEEFKSKLVNDYLDIHLTKGQVGVSNLFGALKDHSKQIVSLDVDSLKRRKNPPQELRELLGEISDDTGYNSLLKTFEHVGNVATQISFIKNFVDFGTGKSGSLTGDPVIIKAELKDTVEEGKKLTKEDYEEAPEGYTALQIGYGSDTNLINTAPLANGEVYYVLSEMATAVKAILNPEFNITETEAQKANKAITKVGAKLTGLSLGAKTLGSIGFYTRNIVSNMFFFGPSQGFWRVDKMAKSLQQEWVRKKYLSMEPEEVSAFHRTMIQLGVVGNEIEARLLQDFLTNPKSEADIQKELLESLDEIEVDSKTEAGKDALDKGVDFIKGSELIQKGRKQLRGLGRLRELSQTVDNFYKIAYFMNELEVLQQARAKHVPNTTKKGKYDYSAMSDYQLMELAARKVKRTAQSYDQAPPFVQKMQESWFGIMFAPFIRFKIEVPRIMLNTIMIAREEMADPNPVIKKRGQVRMGSFFGVLVGYSAITPAIVNALTGIGEEEDEALRDSMPEYLRSNTFFYYNKGGKLHSLDFTYINPYAMMVDPILRSFEELMRGSPSEAGAAFFKAMVADQYLDQQILAGAVTSALNNRDPENGRPITEANDTAWEAFSKKFQFIFSEAYMPKSVETVARDGFVKLMEGDPDISDFIMTPLGALVKEFRPFKPYEIVPEKQLDRFLSERAGEYRRAAALKNRMYTDDPLSEDAIRGMADREIERRRRINEHLIKTFRGYKKLGLTDEQIYAQALERGYGKRRVALLLNGLMERPALQVPFIRNMAVKGDTHIERLRTFQNQLETYGRYIPVE